VVEGPDGERRTFSSDHIAFHRFVEGLPEDFDLSHEAVHDPEGE
jgi:hypothetical protein